MKLPFKIAPALFVLLHVLTFVGIAALVVSHESDKEKIKNSILCDFFVQIQEWQDGTVMYISPDFASRNEQGALRTYEQVIQAELGLCEEGLCLDSTRVQLLKSCPDETSVDVLKDTVIYY